MLETYFFSQDVERGEFKFEVVIPNDRAISVWQDELSRRIFEHRFLSCQESTRYAQEYAKKKFAGCI